MNDPKSIPNSNIRSQYEQIIDQIDNHHPDGLKLLIHLYTNVIETYEHDIADAIPLYITGMGDMDTYNYLQTLSKTIADPYLQNEYKYWMVVIKNKLEHP